MNDIAFSRPIILQALASATARSRPASRRSTALRIAAMGMRQELGSAGWRRVVNCDYAVLCLILGQVPR
jgi:hypothetical protein